MSNTSNLSTTEVSDIDSILGDILTCDEVAQLRSQRRAVTPNVVYYGEWTVRAIRPESYRPWFIGSRAQRSQIEAPESELESISYAPPPDTAPQPNTSGRCTSS